MLGLFPLLGRHLLAAGRRTITDQLVGQHRVLATACGLAFIFGVFATAALGDFERPPGWKEAKPRPDVWQWTPQTEAQAGAVQAFEGVRVCVLPLSNSSDIASHLRQPPEKSKQDKVLSRLDADARRRLVGLVFDNKRKLVEGLITPRAPEQIIHEGLTWELEALGAEVLAAPAGQATRLPLDSAALSELAATFEPGERPGLLIAGEITDFFGELERHSKPIKVQVRLKGKTHTIWMPHFLFRSSITMAAHLVAFDVARSRVVWEGRITQGHPKALPETMVNDFTFAPPAWELVLNAALRELFTASLRDNFELQEALSARPGRPVEGAAASGAGAAESPGRPTAEGAPQAAAGQGPDVSQKEDQAALRTEIFTHLTSKSALATASAAGSTVTVRDLIAAGAEVDERDRFGRTPLMWAAFGGRTDTARVLLEAGADVNAATQRPAPVNWADDSFEAIAKAPLHEHVTALIVAAVRGQRETVSALIDAGAELDAATDSGWTALMAGASTGEAAVVAVLLREGADPALRSELGETARQVAQRLGKWEVVRLFGSPAAATTAATGAPDTDQPGARQLPDMSPTVFKKVGYYAQQGEKTKERDAQLIVSPRQRLLTFADEDHPDRQYESVPWDRITALTYENAKHIRVKTAVIIPWSVFMRGTKHWLTITYGPGDRGQPGGAVVARLDKKNYQAILATLNGQTGIEVRQIDKEGDVHVLYPGSPTRAEPTLEQARVEPPVGAPDPRQARDTAAPTGVEAQPGARREPVASGASVADPQPEAPAVSENAVPAPGQSAPPEPSRPSAAATPSPPAPSAQASAFYTRSRLAAGAGGKHAAAEPESKELVRRSKLGDVVETDRKAAREAAAAREPGPEPKAARLAPGRPLEIASLPEEVVTDGLAHFFRAGGGELVAQLDPPEIRDHLGAGTASKLKVVDGKVCIACAGTIQIAPNLAVPLNPFFTGAPVEGFDLEVKIVFDGQAGNQYYEFADPGGETWGGDNLDWFIKAGAKGAKLKKVGRSFELLEGSAEIVYGPVGEGEARPR